MASEKKLTHESLAQALPPELADALRQLREANFSPYAVLMLFFEYGTELVSFVQDVIQALTAVQQKAKAQKARAKAKAENKAGCDDVIADALCETQCNIIHALLSNHLAIEAAGIDPVDPDEPVEPADAKQGQGGEKQAPAKTSKK